MRSEVSVLTSDSAKIRQQRKLAILETRSIEGANQKEMIDDMIRSHWVMNRMKWLSLL
jgi:hypothetical protein